MSCVEARILDFNYAFQSNVTKIATSADASFPVSNFEHEFASRVWRSAGNFVIGTTNNKIDFTVTGIFKRIPHNSHLRFDFLSQLEGIVKELRLDTGWWRTDYYT